MDERLFDEARPLDAIVGLPLESDEAPASLSSGAGGTLSLSPCRTSGLKDSACRKALQPRR